MYLKYAFIIWLATKLREITAEAKEPSMWDNEKRVSRAQPTRESDVQPNQSAGGSELLSPNQERAVPATGGKTRCWILLLIRVPVSVRFAAGLNCNKSATFSHFYHIYWIKITSSVSKKKITGKEPHLKSLSVYI